MTLPEWIKAALAAADVPPRPTGRLYTNLPRMMPPARKETTMDPNACLERLLDAVETNDSEEAVEAARDLLGWMARGGAPPTVGGEMTPRLVADLAMMVLSRWT